MLAGAVPRYLYAVSATPIHPNVISTYSDVKFHVF